MNSSARSRLRLYGLLTREVPVAQITKDSGTVTEYMPGLVDKALFLKTPYALVTGHRERKLRLTWKFPPHWLAFIVLKGAWGRSVCSFMDPVCYNTSICLLAKYWRDYYGYNHSFLIKFNSCLTRKNSCLVLQAKAEPCGCTVTAPIGKQLLLLG